MRWSTAVVALLLLVLLSALTACTAPGQTRAGQTRPDERQPAAPPPDPVPSAAEATRLLEGLRVAPRSRPDTYERDAFGSAWADTDGNGCNQRDDVLLRDAVPDSVTTAPQGRCDHDVLAGRWVDPYTGRLLDLDDLKDPRQAQAVQIDHVVPLAEAWASGAEAWGDARRRRYANDLAGLLAVDGPTNASKGADDPAAWRPRQRYQCVYASHWVAVKSRYGLAADPSEVAALRDMLRTCQSSGS